MKNFLTFLSANTTALPNLEIPTEPKEIVKWFEAISSDLIKFGKRLLIALIILFVGRKLIKWCLKFIDKLFERNNTDGNVSKFLNSLVNITANIILIISIAGILGLQTSSLVALVGSAGLTIGLALQGSLANFAGGVLILVMKPFRLGDYIIVGTTEGTVSGIDIFYTRLLTIDNKMTVIPNGTLSNSNIVNVTNEPIRRLDLTLSIDYSEDIKKVKRLLTTIIESHELILKEQDRTIFVDNFAPSAITIGVRVWIESENYWSVKWDLLEQIKYAFDENNIIIPYDQLDVNIHHKELKN